MSNKQHGGKREGAGRKPLSAREPTVRITVTLTGPEGEQLREIGDGNASRGVRRLLATYESGGKALDIDDDGPLPESRRIIGAWYATKGATSMNTRWHYYTDPTKPPLCGADRQAFGGGFSHFSQGGRSQNCPKCERLYRAKPPTE